MNKINTNILKTFSKKDNLSKNKDLFFSDSTTHLENAKDTDVVFYRLNNNKTSKDNFVKRLNNSSPGLLITNRYNDELEQCTFMVIEDLDFLKLQKYFADIIYPIVNKELKMIGVTGTNGKTSVVNICTQILSQNNKKSFSIGTMGVLNSYGEVLFDVGATTPSYIILRKIISLYQNEYDICVMEVSSHALTQDRLFDLKLDLAAWTSFSRDHLDYHNSMDEYYDAKSLIFKKYLKKGAKVVVPLKQSELIKRLSSSGAKILKTSPIKDKIPLEFQVKYNLDNLEVAKELCKVLLECDNFVMNPSQIKLPVGRFSTIEIEDSLVIIDYSHTPDALENISKAIVDTFKEHTLTVVFGCGGDRDPGKRPLMAQAILPYAKKIIITSDNPRTESPEKIIDDIRAGILSEVSYKTVIKRDEAIVHALSELGHKEVVLIAGKGHEQYQEINSVKYDFSDFEVVHRFINKKSE